MRSLVVRVGATMIRTSRLLAYAELPRRCVTVVVTRKGRDLQKRERRLIQNEHPVWG